MTGTQFLEYAKKHDVELWREGEKIRCRAEAGKVNQKAIETMKSLREELLPLLEDRTPALVEEVVDPYRFDTIVLEVLEGKRPVSDVLYLLENSDVDEHLKAHIRKAMRDTKTKLTPVNRLERVGDILARVIEEQRADPLAEYADLIDRAGRGELAKGREILLCDWESCEDLNLVVLMAVDRYHRFKGSGSRILGYVGEGELTTLRRAKAAQEALETEGVA